MFDLTQLINQNDIYIILVPLALHKINFKYYVPYANDKLNIPSAKTRANEKKYT